jgi:hypothetical protein
MELNPKSFPRAGSLTKSGFCHLNKGNGAQLTNCGHSNTKTAAYQAKKRDILGKGRRTEFFGLSGGAARRRELNPKSEIKTTNLPQSVGHK